MEDTNNFRYRVCIVASIAALLLAACGAPESSKDGHQASEESQKTQNYEIPQLKISVELPAGSPQPHLGDLIDGLDEDVLDEIVQNDEAAWGTDQKDDNGNRIVNVATQADVAQSVGIYTMCAWEKVAIEALAEENSEKITVAQKQMNNIEPNKELFDFSAYNAPIVKSFGTALDNLDSIELSSTQHSCPDTLKVSKETIEKIHEREKETGKWYEN